MLRILCLHDKHSNAFQFSSNWKILEEKLREQHGIELVYFNGPIITQSKMDEDEANTTSFSTSEANVVDKNDELAKASCSWWSESEEIAQSGLVLTDAESIRSVTGLDASLLLLRQIWVSSPFVGIMGIGQGASIASLLAASILEPQPRFLIFINGVSLFPDEEQLSTIPTLHLVDNVDDPIPTQKKLLLQQFPGVVTRGTGRQRDDLNAIGRFVCDQTNALLQSSDSLQQVSLQMALYKAECEAEEAIARHIEVNPPSSLMAVIRPNMVALPNHRHQVPLRGAPCPSEFLVSREDRMKTGSKAAGKKETEA